MFTGAFSSLAGILRLVSLVICLIVIASFAVFVVDQTGEASTQQQNELSSGAPATTTTPSTSASSPATKPTHKSTIHKVLDEAANELTSPFHGITSGSHSQWTIHGVNTLLALILYGFGLGYLARVLRVRV